MVEKSHASKRHNHAVVVARLYNSVVAYRAAGFRNVRNAGFLCSVNVVAEREESVASYRNAGYGGEVCFLFFRCERFGTAGEDSLPSSVCENVVAVIGDVYVDSVVSVGATYAVKEWERENFRMLAEMPDVRFVSRKTCAVYSRLLTCADADCLSVYCVANGVGLRIFERYKRDYKISYSRFGKIFFRCYYI